MKSILFGTESVCAILEDRKTVTRRVVKPQPYNPWFNQVINPLDFGWYDSVPGATSKKIYCNYKLDDILYVRETWYYETFYEDTDNPPDLPSGNRSWRYVYKADNPNYPVIPGHWRPSIHMPREAARIFLRVTDVRVERLQDITESQAIKEGAEREYIDADVSVSLPAKNVFADIWDSTIKPKDRALYGWEASPWVWVIEFERCEKPEVV